MHTIILKPSHNRGGFFVIVQTTGDFTLEANVFQFTPNQGLYHANYYNAEANFINGIRVGYMLSNRIRPFMSFVYDSRDVTSSGGFSGENIHKHDYQYTLGAEYLIELSDRYSNS